MDATELEPLLDDLTGNIDDLEECLAPLLNTTLTASTSKLPLLDKAKLYVLATYAIESLLFSSLRLNGVDAKTHPVFLELARVKQYFEKIKLAESAGVKRNTTLDKAAAGRFIKHALAGNDKHDQRRAGSSERDKAGPKRKFEEMTERVGSHIRFEGMSKKIRADEAELAARASKNSSSSDEEEEQADQISAHGHQAEAKSSHSGKRRTAGDLLAEDMQDSDAGQQLEQDRKQEKKEKREQKERKRSKVEEAAPAEATMSALPARRNKSSQEPLGHSQAFQALLKGPLPPREEKKKKKHKGKRKSAGEASGVSGAREA